MNSRVELSKACLGGSRGKCLGRCQSRVTSSSDIVLAAQSLFSDWYLLVTRVSMPRMVLSSEMSE